jgi:hypothetical protein
MIDGLKSYNITPDEHRQTEDRGKICLGVDSISSRTVDSKSSVVYKVF